MGWAEDFQRNIDDWNANVGTAKENVADLTENLQALGLTPTPADVKNAAPVKPSGLTASSKSLWILAAVVILILVLMKSKKSFIAGL